MPSTRKTQQSNELTKILFIGNSFTARNNLPALLTQLAAARGHAIEHRLISAGGASLRMHWNAGTAPNAIESGQYDYVVLQEQSTLPIKNAKRMHENVRLFDEAIKAAGARTVLYLTWAREHSPESQHAIDEAYLTIGAELDAIVVPVGMAWERFVKEHEEPVLYDKDQSHPSLAGSYLAACVFFAVLFDEDPCGIDSEVPKMSAAERAILQQTAWQARRLKKNR